MLPSSSGNEEQIRQLEAAIAAQDALRGTLGDAVVDIAVRALRAKLDAVRSATPASRLEAPEAPLKGAAPTRYSVLFADLAGFTALSEQLDPDEVREFLDHLMLELCDAIEQFEGLVVKFLGDAVVAVFNAEGGEETSRGTGSEDVVRAANAALLMDQRTRELDAEWRERLGHPVRLHIGLEAGGLRTKGGATQGQAIAAASDLQKWADAGEILVGLQAFTHSREQFRYSPRPPPGSALGDVKAYTLLGHVDAGGPKPLPVRALDPASPDMQVTDGGIAGAVETELRQATVVFADLANSAAIRQALPGKELESFQQDLMRALSEAAGRYGGTTERFFGDAVMVLFGAPITHEDDPERAVRCAVLMRELAEGLNRRWQSRIGGPIALIIGINTGRVVAGGIVLGAERTYAVTGDTLNTAARLRSAARPGEILLGPDTVRLVSHVAALESLPLITLKGKARPVQAHRLQSLREFALSMRGLSQRGIASSLVGRELELQTFREALQRLREGHGGILAVTGEPGLGKSRLFAEARSLPGTEDLLWLEGRTLSYSAELSYWPFLQILRHAVGIREADDESVAWACLERRLESLFGGEIDEPLAYLATMMGLEITGELAERVRHLDAEAVGRQIFRAARRFFEALAREKPLVLVLEDIHWMDESSAALAEHLLPLTSEVPLLFCWASRPYAGAGERLLESAQSDFPSGLIKIDLKPLARAESDQLLRNLLQNALPTSVRRSILDKADGNPFFVEEVIRGMVDLGTVTQDRSGAWRAAPEVEQMAIPDTIQGVILARIDRLDEDLRRLLRLASVIGRSFFLRVLKSISDGEEAIDSGVLELTELELLREKGRAPELEYFFRHALVQETTYETIVKRRRKELHGRVAESMEKLFSDRLDEFYGLLAFHSARAEDWDRAQRYLLLAGDQAARIAADAEALAHYQHAADACEHAFGAQWEPSQRGALDRRMGEALFRRGHFQEAATLLASALERFGRRYPKTKPGVRRAILGQIARQLGHSQFPHLFLRKGRAVRFGQECSEMYSQLSWIHYTVDQELLVLDCLSTLNEAEVARDPVSTSRGLMGVGLLLGAVALHGAAGRYHRRAVRVAERHRHPIGLGQAFLGMGVHLYDIGDWDGCARVMEQSRTTYLEAGDLRGWGAASAWIFWMAVYRGEFRAALEIADGMGRFGEESADGQLSRFGMHYRGAALSRTGDIETAVSHLEEAVERYRAVPEVIGMAHAAGDLGLCYARLNDLPRAIELLEEANRELDTRGLSAGGCVPPRAALAEVYLLAAERAQAGDRADLLGKSGQAVKACLRLGRLHHESLVFGYRAEGTLYWLQGRKPAAQISWRRALTLAERLGARHEIARSLQESGRHMSDGQALFRAEGLFEQVGAGWELKRTRDLLAENR